MDNEIRINRITHISGKADALVSVNGREYRLALRVAEGCIEFDDETADDTDALLDALGIDEDAALANSLDNEDRFGGLIEAVRFVWQSRNRRIT